MQDAVIGFTGPSGVGKDTLAQALQRCPRKDAPSWVVVHSKFALGLRGMVYLLQGLDVQFAGDRDYEDRHGIVDTMISLSNKILAQDQLIWVDVEAHLRARLLQDLASRGVRKVQAVISDVRQDHEQRAIAESGGIVVELSRDGVANDPDRLDGLLTTPLKLRLTSPEEDAAALWTLAISRSRWNYRQSPTEKQILRRLSKVMEDLNLGGPDDPAQVLELAWEYLRSLNQDLADEKT